MNIEDIERIKKIINFCKNNKECKKSKMCNDCYIEFEDVQAIETLLTAYEKEKEKNNKIEEVRNELEKHIKFCEQEAEGSLDNEICHISLKFNKSLLDIINEEE